MRRILLLCGLPLFLSSGIAYTTIAPSAAVVQDQYPDTAEGWVKMYEDEAQKCAKEAYALHLEIQRTREQLAETNGAALMVLAYTYLQQDYVKACGDYHHYIRQAGYARSHLATPTPTPTPIPPTASPDPRAPSRAPSPSGTGTLPIWPRAESDLHVKFITDQKRKLRELKERADKLIKEANDLLNKAKSTKTKPSKPGHKTEFDSTNGLFTVKFTTPTGVLRVHLPHDIRPGEKVSGSVVVEPKGQTEEERIRNWNSLADSRVIINKQTILEPKTITHEGNTFTLLAPQEMKLIFDHAQPTFEDIPIQIPVLSNDSMWRGPTNLSESPATKESKATESQTPIPKDFHLPGTAQNGAPAEIKGPFDGNLGTTDIKIGGQPVVKLAESPRSCIFKSPEQNFGAAEITLKENNVEVSDRYRNLGIGLNAPKTNLMRGEKTTVTIEVSGLAGIKQDVPLHLEAEGVINMDGGNYQYVNIRPQDVKSDGRYTTTRTITGQQAGGFGVTATVIDLAHRPIIIPLTENARVNGFRVKKEGDKFVIEVEGVQSPITGKPVDGEQKLEHQCPTLSKIPYISRLFLNKGIGRAKSDCLVLITPRIIIEEDN